ncbi:resolvase [Bacillus toyonensis]|nr:resolvase [Bacillus toyonensis]PEF95971.1 resolvase [Bacillus toyonensis]PGC62091.1 resolvase [Bacillus toyonensis]PHD93173.1 resolvase [Bacillus toyonensis]
MRKIGYVRVSSVDQNPKRQLQQIDTYKLKSPFSTSERAH